MLTRWAAPCGTAAILVLAAAESAAAQSPGGCASADTWGRCWVTATDPGRPGGPASPPSAPGGTSKGSANSGGPRIACASQAWTPPPAGDPLWGGHDPSQGTLRFELCQSGGASMAWPRVVFAPNPQGAAEIVVVSPAELARQAIADMGLAAPDIRLAPAADSPHGATIGFPVWMWTARREATTGPVTRTATAGGVSVTATATLAGIDWAMGDSSIVHCGPGTPFTPEQAGQLSPSCGHVYLRTSPDAAFPIAATSRWQISWAGGGQSAFQTMSLTARTRLPVREIRTLNTRTGER